MSSGVGQRCGLDLALPWLWRRPVATVPNRPLAWELPYAEGSALEKTKQNKTKQKKNHELLSVQTVAVFSLANVQARGKAYNSACWVRTATGKDAAQQYQKELY